MFSRPWKIFPSILVSTLIVIGVLSCKKKSSTKPINEVCYGTLTVWLSDRDSLIYEVYLDGTSKGSIKPISQTFIVSVKDTFENCWGMRTHTLDIRHDHTIYDVLSIDTTPNEDATRLFYIQDGRFHPYGR